MNTQILFYARLTLVVLTLSLAAMHTSNAFTDTEKAKGRYTETIEREFDFKPGGTFSVTNRNGSITIKTWDEDRVKIVAEKYMRIERAGVWVGRFLGFKQTSVDTEEEAQALFKEFDLKATEEDNALTITTHRPNSQGHIQLSMSYQVFLPRNVEVSVESRNGRVSVRGVNGSVSIITRNGRVTVEDTNGPVIAQTHNGTVTCEGISGSLDASTVNGSVKANFSADFDGSASISCQAVNGSVRLYLPSSASFYLDAQTRNGSIRTDFELSSVETETKKRLVGVVGEGGARLNLETVNGSIFVYTL